MSVTLNSDVQVGADQFPDLLPWLVGEGLPLVLQKLTDRICRWGFVDMAEMLPEFWPIAKAKESEKEPRI